MCTKFRDDNILIAMTFIGNQNFDFLLVKKVINYLLGNEVGKGEMFTVP